MITFRQLSRGIARWWVLALIVAVVASSTAPVAAQSPPAAPSSVTVTRGDGYLKASWPAVSGATKYHVTYSSDNGASWSLASRDHTTNSITISGVENAKTYLVSVRGGNNDGWGGWTSASADPYESPKGPAAPSSIKVTRGDGYLKASWPAVAGATSYHVTYQRVGGPWVLAALNHPTNSITITDLIINAATYVVGVRARNADGDSGWTNSPPAGPYTPPPPLDAPSSVSITRGDGHLDASWPAVDGATKYHVTYSSDNGASWSLASRDHTTNSITISGVENAKTYLVGVRGGNDDVWGGWTNSKPADPYQPPKPPAAPASVTVTRGDGYLDASWPAVDGATKYDVAYSSDDGATWTDAALDHTTNSITISGADNAETYVVRVRAGNADAWSGWTISASADPYQPPKPPAAPASVTVTRGDGYLDASWPAVDGATKYDVAYSSDDGATWTDAALDHTTNSITISGADNAETYVVRVRAGNDHGWGGWTSSASADPYAAIRPPAIPAGLTVLAGDGGVTLTWNDPSDPTITGYEYQVNHNDTGTGNLSGWGDWTAVPNSGADTTRHAIDGLTNGKEYRYKLRAVNAGGASEPAPDNAPWYVAATPGQVARIASDNDTDNDNLIEVTTVAQFIAMQWDLNGDGTPESETTKYNNAFTSGVSGCSSTCAGYEITADLTITANPTDAGTSYLIPGTWNTTFQGNGNTITNNDSRPLFENIGAASGSTTGEVKSLNVDNSGATNAILADKVQAKGKVTNTGVTGKVTVSGNSTRGGLVNELAGGVISGSHSYADVSVTGGDAPPATQYQYSVGGLVGYVASGGQVLSSHATGNVSYTKSGGGYWDGRARRYVGGLVGRNAGTIYAAFAWGSVQGTDNYRSINDATLGRTRTVTGGLIGRVESGGVVRSGYATGAVSVATVAPTRPHNEFGASIAESAGTVNYVYGSGTVSPGEGSNNNPTGTSVQTESALQTPTGYTGIYANWNFDIDNADGDDNLTTGTDDPWHFGTSTELPVFDYTPQGGTPLPPADLQPASLTLTASSTTIAEGNTTTITASLASSKTYAVRVTQPDGETRYTYDITVAKGSTSATGTFTSVENTSPTSDLSVALTASRTYPTNQVTIVSTSSTIAVQDDEIHNVNNVAGAMSKETDNSYSVTVTWDAPGTENTRNATGYDLDYKISTDATWTTVSISGIATVTHKLTNLTVFRTYEIRMRAKSASLDGAWSSTVSVGVGDDHDADDDGLIDVGNLAQLNAIRYDLNADGAVSSTDETSYLAAFTNAIPGMGCPSTGCTGYELTAALDFDTNNSGGPNAGDTYWNSGAGWQPIGHTATGFSGTFEGNSRAIAGLFINRTSTTTDYFAGLFGEVESGATIRNLVLSDVSVTLTGATSGTLPEVYAGGLAGRSAGTIAGVDVYGTVKGDQPSATGAGKYPNAGGLLGRMEGGSITTSSFTGAVTAEQNDVDDDGASYAGGLVGYKNSGDIWTSFTRGSVKATMSATGNDDGVANAGGLVGYNVAGNIHTAYSLADVNAEAKNAVSGSSSSYLRAGFMAGYWMNGSITNTYGAGRPTVTQPSGGNATDRREGMAGHFNNGTVSDSWFDTTVSGIPDPGFDFNGRGRTTTQMQTPTGYTGDYANWNANVDGVTGNDDPWDFGTASQYPVFKYGRTAGSQRPAVTLSVSPTSICETTKGSNTNACGANPVTSATLTATLNAAQKLPITVTFTPASPIAYSLSAATATIAAGATTASVTVTAVNNYTDAADATVTIGGTVSESWVPAPAGVSLTIKDDDLLAKPTGLKLSVDGTKVRVDWTAVTSATGYTVQWSSSSTFTSPSSAASSTTNHSVTSGLTSGTTYYFRVIANATGYDDSAPSDSVSTAPTTGNVDYDADNDGLIEVSTLAQLNAIRWDLDGNGAVASGDQTNYDTAFPNAEDNMGCNESAVTIASNNTGNPACTGYELSANLDFDTGTAGDRTDDTYYNSGSGWEPIGGVSGSSYTGDFNGNTYTISNLFIDRGSGNYAGLFAKLDGANQTIENVSLVNVDVTFNPSSGSEVYTGGLAGYVDTGVTVEDSYVTGRVRAGESSTDPVTLTASDLNSDVGGLVGRSSGSIISSYSLADVTAHSKSSQTGIATNVGGLVGLASGGSVTASYASGVVSGNTVAQNNGRVHAGGLTGSNNGSVSASYARGDVSGDYDAVATTSVTGRARVGGLVGWQVGNVTASFSTGAPTATGDGTLAAGGLVGAHTGGTNTNSYWDTATSGIADDADNNSPEGKTTSELQTPTAYGTGSSLYANWNLNLDGVTGNDDPWDFGTASQYPVLKYGGQTASQQRVTVTLTASPTTIWERALSASQTPDNTARVNASTLTLTPDSAWDKSIVVTLPASAAVYTLGASTVTFNAGSTTAQTTTMTAVNNYVDAANNAISLAITADSPWVTIGTAPTVTINDDDELTKPAGVKLSVDGTKIRVDWTAVTGATGYKVQWNSTSSTSWTSPSEGTVSSGSTVTYTINPTPALSANTRYYVRVLPTKSGADEPPSDVVDVKTHATGANATVDYDADNDGLIEITTLAQLNAVRWDLDGDGVASSGNETNYATAFPNAEDNMGCNESAVTIASNNTGNPACTGYELRANLDFDTDGDGTADSGDTYWNGGAGWTPIGDFTTAFTATFDGNNDTDASGDGGPYTIANLFINASTTADDATPDIGGLFGRIGKGGAVTNLGLPGVSVTVSSTLEDAIHVGALTADNRGTVTGSWSTGSVTGSTDQNNKTAWISVGGLVGRNDKGGSGDTAYEGVVRAGYSHAAVTGKGRRQANGGEARVGGLVGVNKGTIAASYAAGNVTATNSVSGTELNKGFSGGLVGVNSGTITASYSRGGVNSSATNVTAGGLVGDNESGGTITASFSTGRVTKTVDNTPSLGGLVGANAGSSSFSYWDTETSGQSTSPAGTGKTTSDLQTPTEYGPTASIYHTWNVNVDGVTGDDDPWHFGAANQYPVLKFGAHTAADQRAAVTLSISPATIWESDTGGSTRATTSTLTATLDRAWNEDVAVTVPTNAAYTSSATTITISAGSTTGTATLTAVNNFKCGTSDCPSSKVNNTVALTQATHPADTKWIVKGTDVSITINDDDELAKPTGVKLTADGTKIRVDWTAVTGATGYKVQWNTSDAWTSPSEGTVSSGSTTNYTINPSTPLTANTRYYVRVLPTKSGADEPPSDVKDTTTRASAGTGDYDADNDGLIEITTLAQLNAMRWDLDGNGVADDAANATGYAAAFPNAEDNMGCNESVVTIASGPGNPPCTGYELRANLRLRHGRRRHGGLRGHLLEQRCGLGPHRRRRDGLHRKVRRQQRHGRLRRRRAVHHRQPVHRPGRDDHRHEVLRRVVRQDRHGRGHREREADRRLRHPGEHHHRKSPAGGLRWRTRWLPESREHHRQQRRRRRQGRRQARYAQHHHHECGQCRRPCRLQEGGQHHILLRPRHRHRRAERLGWQPPRPRRRTRRRQRRRRHHRLLLRRIRQRQGLRHQRQRLRRRPRRRAWRRRHQGDLLLRRDHGHQLRQFQHLRQPLRRRPRRSPGRRQHHRLLFHRRPHHRQGRRNRHRVQGRPRGAQLQRDHNRRLLGHREVRRNRHRSRHGQDRLRAQDPHRLRHGRERHLQGLGHRPGHDDGGDPGRLGLRHERPVPGHQVRPYPRRPARHRHPVGLADRYLGARPHQPQPRQRCHHNRHPQRSPRQRRRRDAAHRRRLHAEQRDHHHRRRLDDRNHHPDGGEQPGERGQQVRPPGPGSHRRRPPGGRHFRPSHPHHQRRRRACRPNQRRRLYPRERPHHRKSPVVPRNQRRGLQDSIQAHHRRYLGKRSHRCHHGLHRQRRQCPLLQRLYLRLHRRQPLRFPRLGHLRRQFRHRRGRLRHLWRRPRRRLRHRRRRDDRDHHAGAAQRGALGPERRRRGRKQLQRLQPRLPLP